MKYTRRGPLTKNSSSDVSAGLSAYNSYEKTHIKQTTRISYLRRTVGMHSYFRVLCFFSTPLRSIKGDINRFPVDFSTSHNLCEPTEFRSYFSRINIRV